MNQYYRICIDVVELHEGQNEERYIHTYTYITNINKQTCNKCVYKNRNISSEY